MTSLDSQTINNGFGVQGDNATRGALKAHDFKAEIPMFHSDSIDIDKLIENIELFPIDHV